jgi:4-amino-4-deoxy-L-arabinose transferase-like glycosyltransferase
MSRTFAVRLAGIVVAGVALRAVYLLTVGRDVTGIGDWWFYHWTANDLADGRFFVEPYRLRFEDKLLPSAGHPPLYPALLAPISALGGTGVLWHRAAGLAFGALSIALMGVLGRRVNGPRLGLAAAAVCAVYPLMIVVDGALMSETAYTPLVIVVLLLAWSALERPRVAVMALLGLAIGVAALVRSEALMLLPLLAWPVAWRGGAGWPLRALVASAVCAAALAPWTIRNAVEFGRFVPISINDSTVLRGANCPATYSGEDIGFWRADCIPPRRFDNEAEQAAVWREQGLEYMREHAGRLAVVVPVRVLRTFSLYQPRRQVLFAEGRWIRGEQAAVASFYLLALLSVFGALALRRARKPLLVLLAPGVVVLVAVVVGYGHPRLRHVFEPSLMLLGAAGALWLTQRVRGGDRASARRWARAASAGS